MSEEKIFIGGVVFWLACGWVAWGGWLADTRYELREAFSCRSALAPSAMLGLTFGPIALVISMGTTGFYEHGFQWTCPDPPKKQR